MATYNPPPPPPLPPNILSDPPGSAQASFGDGNNARPRERRFVYDGKEFEDPGSQYSIRDVMMYLAQTYPELANGSWTKAAYHDYDEITFYKVTGEKGLDRSL